MSIHLNAASKAKALDFYHKLSLWRMMGNLGLARVPRCCESYQIQIQRFSNKVLLKRRTLISVSTVVRPLFWRALFL